MKKITRFAALSIAAIALLTPAACNKKEETVKKVSFSDTVDNVTWIGMVTGPNSISETDQYQVGGTDLGFPIYNSTNDTMYLAFGDTFMNAASQSGLWRSNVLGYTKDFNLSDGIEFDGFISTGANVAKAIVEGYHMDEYEMTKIPTGGVEVNGVMYMWYFSKYSWNNAAEHSMNYGGAVKSADNGKTWERVNDLSWLDDSVPERKEHIEKIANEDIGMHDTGVKVATMETHAAYGFTQICPVDGKDGYVYIFGEGGYRTGGIRLGRVKYADIEVFAEYEYFNGTDAQGNAIWLKGIEGLKTIHKNNNSYIISTRCLEHCIMYNAYLQKWMIVYRGTGGMVYHTADKIYGTYSDPEILFSYDYTPFPNNLNSMYSGVVHEKWTEQNGKIFYFIMSQWKPVYNTSLVKVELK